MYNKGIEIALKIIRKRTKSWTGQSLKDAKELIASIQDLAPGFCLSASISERKQLIKIFQSVDTVDQWGVQNVPPSPEVLADRVIAAGFRLPLPATEQDRETARDIAHRATMGCDAPLTEGHVYDCTKLARWIETALAAARAQGQGDLERAFDLAKGHQVRADAAEAALKTVQRLLTYPSDAKAGPFPPLLEASQDRQARFDYQDRVIDEAITVLDAALARALETARE